MALAKPPGPEGLHGSSQPIDSGTLSRSRSPLPGASGLFFVPPFPMQVKGAGRLKGIRIHQKSQISADEWVKKITASDEVPDYFKKQIKSSGNVIFVTSTDNFRVPTNVISKDWLSDWLSAFAFDEWEMTTGVLDITVKKGGADGPLITITHNPDLSDGESIDGFTKFTMTEKGSSTKSLTVERGNTLPTGVKLNSKRKAIAVANRIHLSLEGKIKTFKFADSELLEVWFHEIAAHAGRNSTQKSDAHGDKTVDAFAKDILEMFPASTTVPQVNVEIKSFLGK
jgi:hypothetical protein